jgi:hypothetical protein
MDASVPFAAPDPEADLVAQMILPVWKTWRALLCSPEGFPWAEEWVATALAELLHERVQREAPSQEVVLQWLMEEFIPWVLSLCVQIAQEQESCHG